MKGSSFWFHITDEKFEVQDELTIATITGVKLYEAGPVVFPAYKATSAELAKRYIEKRKASFDRFRSTLAKPPPSADAAVAQRIANYARIARARSIDV